MCSVNSAESLLYNSVFALQSGVTLAAITFCLNRIMLHLPPSLSQLTSSLLSFFQSKTRSLLVIGVILHVLSLLSSSFVEEEHQTWYLFTSALFVMIFLEKSAMLCTSKSYKDSETPETIARQVETSEVKRSRKYIEEKSFDHEKEVRNARIQKDLSNSKKTGVNMDGLSPKKQQDTAINNDNDISYSEDESCEDLQWRWEAIEEITPKTGVLPHLLAVLILLGLGRLSRSWNQTGIKWADRPDIGDWLVKPENRTVMSLCYLISLLVIVGFRYNRHNVVTSLVFTIGAVNAYVYRTVTGSLQLPWIPNEPITKGIRAACFTYCCIATILVWNVIILYRASRHNAKRRNFQGYICKLCGSLEGLLSAVLLLEILLQRPHNVTLLAIFVGQEHVLSKMLWKR